MQPQGAEELFDGTVLQGAAVVPLNYCQSKSFVPVRVTTGKAHRTLDFCMCLLGVNYTER
jgi:hypothetical protein